jgi:hypothetical protein
MAIVIPVTVQGLRVASLAGEVAERKGHAGRIAERVLNEILITTNSAQSSLSGHVTEGTRDYEWTLRNEQWTQNLTNRLPATASAMNQLAGSQPAVNQLASSQITMNLMTVEVHYAVQNKDYSVRLSTLVNPQQ